MKMTVKKTCRVCRKSLSEAAFNGSSRFGNGLSATCRACTNARRRQLNASRTARRTPSENLATALRKGDIKKVQARLRSGQKPRWDWVCETMREGHLALAELLLQSGIERDVFTMAAMADVTGIRRRLRRVHTDARLAVRMEPSSTHVTPLHVACSSDWRSHGASRMTDQVDAAKLLNEHGADVNAIARYRGLDDVGPLFCACWSSGNLPLVQWLLEQGVEPTDQQFAAALGHFQRHGRGNEEIAAALLAAGVPVDGSIPGDRTPLQAFAAQGDHRTVSWLIAHGADVNARCQGGRTAAHLAAERNTGPKTLAILADSGADLNVADADGHTPLDIAKLSGKSRVVEWLTNEGRSRR